MAFKGVYEAQKLVPAPYGLFSAADVIRHGDSPEESRWINGYSFEVDSAPTVRILNSFAGAVAGSTIATQADKRAYDVKSFFIEVEVKSSGMGLLAEDILARAERQIDAATQKAVERELWSGISATENDNLFLSMGTGGAQSNGAVVLTSGTGVTPKKAVSLLHGAMASSPTGSAGVVHVTPEVASLIDTRLIWGNENDTNKVYTALGAPVVPGTGYTGDGPVGNSGAAASGTNGWIYATGPITVHLGKPEIVNENLSQGFRSSTNDLTVKALRPVAVHFDPTIFFAAQITLPAAP